MAFLTEEAGKALSKKYGKLTKRFLTGGLQIEFGKLKKNKRFVYSVPVKIFIVDPDGILLIKLSDRIVSSGDKIIIREIEIRPRAVNFKVLTQQNR